MRATGEVPLRQRAPGVGSAVLVGAAGLGGLGLGAAFALAAVVRRSRPLHPVGIVTTAHLDVSPAAAASGSPLLDEPGGYDCLVRASWAAGTGPRYPDIEGFALRVLGAGPDGAVTDVLFSSTGVGPLARHVLTFRRPGRHGPQTTLLPVRAGGRPLLLRLDPLDDGSGSARPTCYRLSWAHGRGAWHDAGILTPAWGPAQDAPDRFDPVAHPLVGTAQYPVVAALREPAYRFSRRAWPRAGRHTAVSRPGPR